MYTTYIYVIILLYLRWLLFKRDQFLSIDRKFGNRLADSCHFIFILKDLCNEMFLDLFEHVKEISVVRFILIVHRKMAFLICHHIEEYNHIIDSVTNKKRNRMNDLF